MIESADSLAVALGIGAQVIGLASVGLARVGERTTSVLASQAFFLISLLLVGLTTLFTLSTGNGTWLVTGATLPIMVVGATIDLRPGSQMSGI